MEYYYNRLGEYILQTYKLIKNYNYFEKLKLEGDGWSTSKIIFDKKLFQFKLFDEISKYYLSQ